jgi:hypothetical protein
MVTMSQTRTPIKDTARAKHQQLLIKIELCLPRLTQSTIQYL